MGNMVMIAGEITTQAKLDYDKIVRGAVAKIGYDSYVDDLSSVDSKGLSDKTCEVIVRINKQNPDNAGGVHVGKDELDVGSGDQGIMFGYASDDTEDCMPLSHSMVTRLGKKLTDVRKSGKLWRLRPDGKAQVAIEYLQKADGSMEPRKSTPWSSQCNTRNHQRLFELRCARATLARDDKTKHGGFEQIDCRGSHQGDAQGDYHSMFFNLLLNLHAVFYPHF